ncbi:MAG: CoA-binding protein [Deltaproteobacteria bacterium]|nr:CoA-binding protein [Deltaproteobacteria bacterium]
MFKSIQESPLYALANSESMAFFGASNNITSMGTNLLMSVQAMGFEGKIYPVHPKEDTVLGTRAYQDVKDIPEVPDLAVVVLPTRIVNETLEACGTFGIRNVIVVSGGFKEVGGGGVARERVLVDIVTKYDMSLLGPNCLGVANPHHKLNTTFIPYEGPPGFIGLASQSGSLITQLFDYLARLGLGFSTAFSVGNEATTDLVDCMEYLGACPHTKVIALYIEGIKRGRTFMEAARSIVPHKPIVAFYIGGSEAGKRAGFSHTGAMAGPDGLYDGLFRQSGIIRARSVTELFDFCWLLGSARIPEGRKVVIQTHSGGPGAAAADSCGRAGLDLPGLSRATLDKLAPFVPGTGSVNNPVDLTFSKNPQDFFSRIPEILIEDENTDVLMIYFLTPWQVVQRVMIQAGVSPEQAVKEGEKIVAQQCEQMARLMRDQDKPIVGFSFRSPEEPSIKGLLSRGVPVFPGPERAAKAIQALTAYGRIRERFGLNG